jgi:isocitrate dehydrogenase
MSCVSYAQFVATQHPKLNLVIVRENEEDLYAGIKHRQTDEVFQCLKLITRPGCERIVRYAFEYARGHGRQKVTCMTKDSIMKMTDGLFRQVFKEVASEYPDIATEHMIIDIGAARLATRPELFDVIVTPNLYGDILSDIAAEMTGSVGLAGSANIGEHVAMFEAIHGRAPDIAGQDVANPSGLLLEAVVMMVHIGQPEVAARVHNAWLCAIEDGQVIADLHAHKPSPSGPLGCMAFAEAVITRLGRLPQHFAPVRYETPAPTPTSGGTPAKSLYVRALGATKALVGVDVFVHPSTRNATELAAQLQAAYCGALQLQMITNWGVKVWPGGFTETLCTDHWRCRFTATAPDAVGNHRTIVDLLGALTDAEVDVIKTENLCTFDGVQGLVLGQGL